MRKFLKHKILLLTALSILGSSPVSNAKEPLINRIKSLSKKQKIGISLGTIGSIALLGGGTALTISKLRAKNKTKVQNHNINNQEIETNTNENSTNLKPQTNSINLIKNEIKIVEKTVEKEESYEHTYDYGRHCPEAQVGHKPHSGEVDVFEMCE